MSNQDYINSLIQQDQSSKEYIQDHELKNRFLNPFLPTMVFDNFYEDPDLWRSYALSQEFYKGNRGSWPGVRSEYLHKLDRPLFDLFSAKIMMILKDYGFTQFHELQTTFQLIDETYGRGWVHDDDPKFTVAGVIYLSPDAPEGSGTTLYSDQTDFNGDLYTEIFMNDVLVADADERAKAAKYREEQIAHFTPTTEIGHVYNRCIMFDPRTWHSADQFFGTDKDNTRLTQVFFIRAV